MKHSDTNDKHVAALWINKSIESNSGPGNYVSK